MPLFKSNNDKVGGSELKQHVPNLNKNMSFLTLLPFIEDAERDYIIPLIGQAQFDELDQEYNAISPNLSAEQEKLIEKIQRPLAYYALYHATPFLGVVVSDLGVMEGSDREGTSNPARQWAYNNLLSAYMDKADTAAEQLLLFMEKHKSDYPSWTASQSYIESRELFINSTAEFNKYVNIQNSRRVWLTLRNWVPRVEQRYIQPLICKPLFDELKAEIAADNIGNENALLLPFIREAVANYTLYEAMPHLAVKVNAGGIQVSSNTDGLNRKDSASREAYNELMRRAETDAQNALANLKKFIDRAADNYPLYKGSDCYQAQAPAPNLPNNGNSKIFFV